MATTRTEHIRHTSIVYKSHINTYIAYTTSIMVAKTQEKGQKKAKKAEKAST